MPLWATITIKLALTVAVTWFVIRQVGFGLGDLAQVGASWWRPDLGLAAAASAVLGLGYVVSGLLWGRMVGDLGGGTVPGARAVRIFLTANLARYVPGKVWQIAGLAMLARREGVGPVVSGSAAVLGQAAALAGATLVGAGTLLGARGAARAWGWAMVGVVALGLALAATPPVAERVRRLWFRAARLGESDDIRVDPMFGARWTGLYFLNWVIYAIAFWLLAMSYGVDGGLVRVGGGFAAAYVLGYLALFAPAGIGVRESFLVLFLSPVTGAGPAGGLAIVSRIWTTVVEVLAALATTATIPLEDGSGAEGQAP